MRKVKYAALILLAAALMILGARLPWIAARVQDEALLGKVFHRDMETLRLSLRPEETAPEQEPLTDTARLALLKASKIDIGEDQAEMTPEEARQAAAAALEPYIESEVIPGDVGTWACSLSPLLCYSPQDPALFNILWQVSLDRGDHAQYLLLSIDDGTGQLLEMSYQGEAGIYPDPEHYYTALTLSRLYKESFDCTTTAEESDGGAETSTVHFTVLSVGETVEAAADVEIQVFTDGFNIAVLRN